jgi:uncharacterized membrane protein YeaQ/YmgE (transglycosylase-associated protein family)
VGIIAWVVLGGVAGWLASLVAGVGARMGCLLNITAGIIGAVLGGLLFNAFGSRGVTGFNWWSLLVAFVGALLLLLTLRLIATIFKD